MFYEYVVPRSYIMLSCIQYQHQKLGPGILSPCRFYLYPFSSTSSFLCIFSILIITLYLYLSFPYLFFPLFFCTPFLPPIPFRSFCILLFFPYISIFVYHMLPLHQLPKQWYKYSPFIVSTYCTQECYHIMYYTVRFR